MVLALYLAFLFWHIDAARDACGQAVTAAWHQAAKVSVGCSFIQLSIILATAVSSIAKVKYNLSK